MYKTKPFQCVLMSQAVGGAGSLVSLADCPLEWIVCFTLDFNFSLRVCFSSFWIMELSLHSSFVSVEDVIILKSDCLLNVVQARDFCFSWCPPRAPVGNALLHCCPAHFCFFWGSSPLQGLALLGKIRAASPFTRMWRSSSQLPHFVQLTSDPPGLGLPHCTSACSCSVSLDFSVGFQHIWDFVLSNSDIYYIITIILSASWWVWVGRMFPHHCSQLGTTSVPCTF